MKSYMCVICGFVYDEADGLPEEGIAAGTRWEDVPRTGYVPIAERERKISRWSRCDSRGWRAWRPDPN